MKPVLRPLAAATLAALSGAAPAQSTPAPQRVEITGTLPLKLDAAATTASRLGITARETPATVTVIDRADIDALGALDTQAVLKTIPGVTYSHQPGAAGSVFYRGFGASSLAQLYNGITVQYDAISARAVDAWLVDHVEAIGGPSSFLHGSGAVGGSINIVTKIADTQGDLTQFRLGAGTQKQAAASLQRSLGGQVLRADLHASSGANDALGDRRSSWQAGLSWLAPITDGLSHTLSLEQQFEKVTQPYWGTPLLRDANNAVLGEVRIDPRTVGVNYNVVDGKYQQDVLWVRSLLNWKIAPRTQATHTLYHYEALRDYENVEVYTWVAANAQVERSSALLQRHNQDVWGSRGELSHQATLFGRRSDFAFGWDWSFNKQTRFPLSVAGPFDRTDPYAPAPTTFLATPGITRVYTPGATNRLHTVALFAENRTVLAEGWALTSGLRADRITLAVRNHRTVTATNPALFETSYRPTTGRLGLVHDLSAQWQVYAQYSTAADPPSGILSTAGFSALRNFDLTKGRQWELGSKLSFDQRRGEASVAVYDIVRRNLAITDPNDRTNVLPVGQQSSRGIELAARWKPASAWQGAVQLAWTDARFDDFFETVGTTVVSRAGNRPANTPTWVAGLQLGWQLTPAVGLNADARQVGRRFANTANTAWESGYTLLGLGATWQLTREALLRLRVDNATDKVYAATVGPNMVVLGAPRTVQLLADLKF